MGYPLATNPATNHRIWSGVSSNACCHSLLFSFFGKLLSVLVCCEKLRPQNRRRHTPPLPE